MTERGRELSCDLHQRVLLADGGVGGESTVKHIIMITIQDTPKARGKMREKKRELILYWGERDTCANERDWN